MAESRQPQDAPIEYNIGDAAHVERFLWKKGCSDCFEKEFVLMYINHTLQSKLRRASVHGPYELLRKPKMRKMMADRFSEGKRP